MTTYRLSYSHAFRRWYGKPLTRTEETLVSHLERQRHLTGRVRAVISVPEAEQAIAENILLHYTLYLHRRFWPWCETMVVDTGTARTRRMIKDDSIVFRPGSRNGGTRGFGTFHHVIGLLMDRYGISLKGDPRGWDAIANLRNSVPDVPNTCVLLVGTYRKRSWRAFSSTYRARLQNNNPDHPYICLDVAALPPMQALPVITRTDWLRLARAPRRQAQPAPRRGLHQVSRGFRRPQADLPADTSPHKPQPAAWRVAHDPRNTCASELHPMPRHPQSACGAIPRLTGCEAARGRAPGKRTDGSQPGPGDPVVMDWPKPSAWQLVPAGISLGRPQIADAFEQPAAPRRPQRTRQARRAPEARAIPQARGRGSVRSAAPGVSQGPTPKPTKKPLNSFDSFDSFNLLSLLTFCPFVPEKPPKLSTHAAAAAAA